jgi:hypothetical protein
VGDDLPTLTLSAAEVGDGISVVQLITRSGLAKSGKEAKRLIADGGARMNDVRSPMRARCWAGPTWPNPIKLSAGKKRHALVSSFQKYRRGSAAGAGAEPPETGTCPPQPALRPPAARCPIHRKIAIITPVAPASISVVRTIARARDPLAHTRHRRRQQKRPRDAQKQVDAMQRPQIRTQSPIPRSRVARRVAWRPTSAAGAGRQDDPGGKARRQAVKFTNNPYRTLRPTNQAT